MLSLEEQYQGYILRQDLYIIVHGVQTNNKHIVPCSMLTIGGIGGLDLDQVSLSFLLVVDRSTITYGLHEVVLSYELASHHVNIYLALISHLGSSTYCYRK